MAKLLGRLFLIAALIAAAYFYVQASSLRAENSRLRARIAALASLRSENASLRAKLAVAEHKPSRPGAAGWLAVARDHVQKAEAMVAEGDFVGALRQSRFADLALGRAASEASGRTRASVRSVRGRLDAVRAQATALWHKLGV